MALGIGRGVWQEKWREEEVYSAKGLFESMILSIAERNWGNEFCTTLYHVKDNMTWALFASYERSTIICFPH